ncbi:MAG: 2,3-bisphosphoglycerate-independent phosphoglycerate mutase [Puniceicoccales bacterium]|nr:2,3-bisphosphoglycerate-independent phosphoglycerate mutase [Puniceicoccales bacterium]
MGRRLAPFLEENVAFGKFFAEHLHMGRRSVILLIRDGWGVISDEKKFDSLFPWDATWQGATPHVDFLRKRWPHTEIRTDGLAVGLPEGVMGNSEVGHQNIGAGRVVDQEIVRIDKAIADGALRNNKVLLELFAFVKKNRTKLHLLGLCSDGGVHAMTRHAIGLLHLAKEAQIPKLCFHAITDGRDVPPGSALGYIEKMEHEFQRIGLGRVASVMGRFWAMDRDGRWERVERAYRCLVGESNETAPSAKIAIENYHRHPATATQKGDEFVPPTLIVDGASGSVETISDGDAAIVFNFRGDRPRELTRAFIDESFQHFPRTKKLRILYGTMTEYEKGLCPNVLFPKPKPMINILGAHLSKLGLKQFRTAETEKYAHVTFFFNDYREEPFAGEERQLIGSPRDVPTYDLKPEMSAAAVCQTIETAIRSKKYDFLVVNFANADMVGHTGNFDAAKFAVEVVDGCVGKIMSAARDVGDALIVAADHGNAEEMWDYEHGSPHTQHTTNPVELFIFGDGFEKASLREGGKLSDIAPTVLDIMGVPKPDEMTGQSLLDPL